MKEKKVKVVKNVRKQGHKLLPELKTAHVKELRNGYKAIIEENVKKKCSEYGKISQKKEWVSYTYFKTSFGYCGIERKSYFQKDLGLNKTYQMVDILEPSVPKNSVKERCLELLVGESNLPSDSQELLLKDNEILSSMELVFHVPETGIAYKDLVKEIKEMRNESKETVALSIEKTLSVHILERTEEGGIKRSPLIKPQF